MLDILDSLIQCYPVLSACKDGILSAYRLIEKCYVSNGKLLVCGNGGSAADADHIVGELMKGFMAERRLDSQSELFLHLQGGLPAISLCAHSGLISAFANDCDPEYVFAQQVYAYSKNSPDLLLALSTSGNSKNVVRAVQTANETGIDSVSITGKNESELSKISTVCIKLPETETYKIQELTLPVYHCLCAMIEKRFFG
ncbi:MAG: SIS domain-containing protein [Clostridia bacterium]|nr:SIS domain-containing protein [Clostridia bacterium]